MELWLPYLGQAVIAGVVSGIAFWATVRTEIKYLRRDVDNAHSSLIRYNGIYVGNELMRDNPGHFRIYSDAACTVKVNGWYCRIATRTT